MKKIICVILFLCLLFPTATTIYSESATKLAAPTGLTWDATIPGKAKWTAVSNESSYSVQLYKGGVSQGSPVTAAANAVEYNFTPAITETGIYTFKVTAVGNGTTYSDSDQSDASPVYIYILGDVNRSGSVNSTDVLLVRRYIAGIAGLVTFDATHRVLADVNGNGIVNSTDVLMMRQYIAGLRDKDYVLIV